MTQKMPNFCKRMRWLSDLKKPCHLSSQMQDYLNSYEIIYKRVIKEAKRKKNDKYVLKDKN
jgi:hypothetical protein